jgi:hypothetical protein
MIDFFWLTAPIFGVVALGWGATRMRIMPAHSLEALGVFLCSDRNAAVG